MYYQLSWVNTTKDFIMIRTFFFCFVCYLWNAHWIRKLLLVLWIQCWIQREMRYPILIISLLVQNLQIGRYNSSLFCLDSGFLQLFIIQKCFLIYWKTFSNIMELGSFFIQFVGVIRDLLSVHAWKVQWLDF